MFGLSFSELILIVAVAIVVIGPKELPGMLRKAGRSAAKLRKMAADLRSQSGIDDVLSTEGLTQDLAEIRKLARGELDGHTYATSAPKMAAALPSHNTYADDYGDYDLAQLREREVPAGGVDVYGALPDTATLYDGLLSEGELAKDPLYVVGEATGVVPDKLPWRERFSGVPIGASSESTQAHSEVLLAIDPTAPIDTKGSAPKAPAAADLGTAPTEMGFDPKSEGSLEGAPGAPLPTSDDAPRSTPKTMRNP